MGQIRQTQISCFSLYPLVIPSGSNYEGFDSVFHDLDYEYRYVGAPEKWVKSAKSKVFIPSASRTTPGLIP